MMVSVVEGHDAYNSFVLSAYSVVCTMSVSSNVVESVHDGSARVSV